MPLLEQAIRQLRAYPSTPHDNKIHSVFCSSDTLASLLYLIGYVNNHDPRLEQQHQSQQHRGLVVQEVVPPVTGNELRYDDGDDLVRLTSRGNLLDISQ